MVRLTVEYPFREVHSKYETVRPHLVPISRFMKRFPTVLSLNYDLTVYWAMLEGNRQAGGTWFKDCFLDNVFEDDWARLRKPLGVARTTLVFYPHGNLSLATDVVGRERKLTARLDKDLLRTILTAWQEGNDLPLFVSEGRTKQKHDAILRSAYLTTVYNAVMSKVSESVAIFGANLGPVDDHILNQPLSVHSANCQVSVARSAR
jgi:hypothetical protein